MSAQKGLLTQFQVTLNVKMEIPYSQAQNYCYANSSKLLAKKNFRAKINWRKVSH